SQSQILPQDSAGCALAVFAENQLTSSEYVEPFTPSHHHASMKWFGVHPYQLGSTAKVVRLCALVET
uniref:hypothetical protein n=1 Tax=Anaplasma marginale TaxID=770 RepID=UPI0019D6B2F8